VPDSLGECGTVFLRSIRLNEGAGPIECTARVSVVLIDVEANAVALAKSVQADDPIDDMGPG